MDKVEVKTRADNRGDLGGRIQDGSEEGKLLGNKIVVVASQVEVKEEKEKTRKKRKILSLSQQNLLQREIKKYGICLDQCLRTHWPHVFKYFNSKF